MRTTLNFEDKETKKLLAKLDFEFFLKQNIIDEAYSQEDVNTLYKSFEEATIELHRKAQTSRRQFNFYLEGQVRKMFTGGFLPALFHLDEGRNHTLFDFKGVGETYAIFKRWQIYYRRKVTADLVWEIVIKTGSILGIVLSIFALAHAFQKK